MAEPFYLKIKLCVLDAVLSFQPGMSVRDAEKLCEAATTNILKDFRVTAKLVLDDGDKGALHADSGEGEAWLSTR